MERSEMINEFYTGYNEENRLSKSRHGQMEYRTTMHFIHRYLLQPGKILELGAGTGRYSIALAKEGNSVTAVELAERNLELLRRNAEGLDNLTAYQGDAIDLRRFADDSFDMTLVFGPLYHLYEAEERDAALREAVRVTKPGGTILTAFLPIHGIMIDNYLGDSFPDGMEENFTEAFRVRHFQDQLFTGYEIDELESLFRELPVTHLTTVAADGVLEMAEHNQAFSMSDEAFEAYARYHLHFCQCRELLGTSAHAIHICRKNSQ